MFTAPIRWLSPLRYPGGKGVLAPFLASLIEGRRPRPTTYIEPFAGGAAVGLYLLFHEYVERIILNDLDSGIAAFWRVLFREPEDLIDLVLRAEISVEKWWEHWQVYQEAAADDLTLGFATLFLNRTNRSGILTARPIGGLNQTGRWKMDARFNREDLAARIRRLSKYRNRVDVRQEDALELLATKELTTLPSAFIYADPPYLSKSGDLYLNNLRWDDHIRISRLLPALKADWAVTYDFDDRVPVELYPDHRCAVFSLSHSAAKQHFGDEYIIFSRSLEVNNLKEVGPHGASWASR